MPAGPRHPQGRGRSMSRERRRPLTGLPRAVTEDPCDSFGPNEVVQNPPHPLALFAPEWLNSAGPQREDVHGNAFQPADPGATR
jgi:hypothetical protein